MLIGEKPLACDLRVMTPEARIGMPIARLDILCSPAFAARLVTLAGPSVARRLLYTGALLDGAAAVDAGLADECVPDADLDARLDQPTKAATARPHGPAVAWADFQQGIIRFLDAGGPHPAD